MTCYICYGFSIHNLSRVLKHIFLTDESRHSVEIPQQDFDSENQPTHHVNTEVQFFHEWSSKRQWFWPIVHIFSILFMHKKVEVLCFFFIKWKKPSFSSLDFQGLIADLRNALSPTKQKMQKAAQRGETKQQLKRGGKVAGFTSVHYTLF
jgi:hypothetical protein